MKYLLGAILAATAIVSTAQAADLIVEPEIAEAAIAAYDWSGPYVGVVGGYGWGDVSSEGLPAAEADISGWLVGAEAGVNWQMDSFVLGLEADIARTGITGDWVAGVAGGTFDLNWLGTATARAGVVADRALLYIEGGIAYGQLTSTGSVLGLPFDETMWSAGWTAGAGIEYALTDDLSAKLEYNYVDIGGFQSDFFDGDPEFDVTAHVVKAGLNLQF